MDKVVTKSKKAASKDTYKEVSFTYYMNLMADQLKAHRVTERSDDFMDFNRSNL